MDIVQQMLGCALCWKQIDLGTNLGKFSVLLTVYLRGIQAVGDQMQKIQFAAQRVALLGPHGGRKLVTKDTKYHGKCVCKMSAAFVLQSGSAAIES